MFQSLVVNRPGLKARPARTVKEMPVKTSFPEQIAFYSLNAAPAPMLDLAGALAYQTLSTAVHLDLFNHLHNRQGTAAELALRLGMQERGLQPLLEALSAIGYVEERDGRYHNSAMTEKWFLDGQILDMKAAMTCWDAFLRDLWPHGPQIISSGERPFEFYQYTESTPGLSDAHQRMMMGNANVIGPDMVKKVALTESASHLLDVGGGHGAFSIHFCRAHPNLHATIIDSSAALQTAQQNISDAGLDERITLCAADLWQADWGRDNDLILLCNLLHHYDLETNHKLLKKAFAALKPGGKVAIFDQVEGNVSGSATNAIVRLVSLMYYLFAGGRTFTRGELARLLNETGFGSIQFHALRQSPGSSLLVAKKDREQR